MYILKTNNIEYKLKTHLDEDDNGINTWFCIWNDLPKLPKKCIIYNMDPMVDNVFYSLKNTLSNSSDSKILLFIDYCYSELNKKRISSINNFLYTIMPYGYSEFHKELFSLGKDREGKEDIDILFYGGIGSRGRMKIVEKIIELCNKNNYKFVCRSDVYDEQTRANLVSRSKIFLSFSGQDARDYTTNDLARLAYPLSNDRFVIADYIGDLVVESKLAKYSVYVKSTEELIEKIDYYLKNPIERQKIIKDCSLLFKADFNLSETFINLLRL